MIEPGKKLPAFVLEDDSGKKVSARDFAGQRWVLFVYPKANTSGCTMEAIDFRDEIGKFNKEKVPVVGLSKDTVSAQKKFKDKFSLPYLLLADPEKALIGALGLMKEKNMYGKKVIGTVRTTVLVDGDGKVERVWSPVVIKGHAADVLSALHAEAPGGALRGHAPSAPIATARLARKASPRSARRGFGAKPQVGKTKKSRGA
jgi:thioredoxin-dependent peroxiredoxin